MAQPLIFSPASRRPYTDTDAQAVGKAVLSGRLSTPFGREAIRFEGEYARFIGHRHAVATSSGTTALETALHCLGIGFGDEVIVPGYTFAVTGLAVLRNLGLVRFADIDPKTWNVTLDTLIPAITPKTRAIIIADMFGAPVDVEPITAYAKERGILVIEDCAQAVGATVNGKQAGFHGDVACHSFNEIKNLTTGEGGMITTNDQAVDGRARLIRLHGSREGVAVELGTKCTMTDMEAALGREQLAKLPAMNDQREAACQILVNGVSELPGITVQQVPPGGRHVYSRFVMRVSPEAAGMDRDTLSANMVEKGFSLAPVYPTPLYRHPVFTDLATGEPKPGLAASYKKIYAGVVDLSAMAAISLPEVEAFCREQTGFIVPADVSMDHAAQFVDAIQSLF